jgi:hypothetical protein
VYANVTLNQFSSFSAGRLPSRNVELPTAITIRSVGPAAHDLAKLSCAHSQPSEYVPLTFTQPDEHETIVHVPVDCTQLFTDTFGTAAQSAVTQQFPFGMHWFDVGGVTHAR